MTASESMSILESRVSRLIDGILADKKEQMDFLIGLNLLDDIIIDHEQKRPINESLTRFLVENRTWLDEGRLNSAHRKQVAEYLKKLFQILIDREDADSLKLAEEVKSWQQTLGAGTVRLTLKAPKQETSLADRFSSLLRREMEELDMLTSKNDHLLTCLDDLLSSAEAKDDKMYQHLAASLTYFLQLEGYKVDPYIKRLRRLRTETGE